MEAGMEPLMETQTELQLKAAILDGTCNGNYYRISDGFLNRSCYGSWNRSWDISNNGKCQWDRNMRDGMEARMGSGMAPLMKAVI